MCQAFLFKSVVPELWLLVTGLMLRGPGFDPRLVRMGFMTD